MKTDFALIGLFLIGECAGVFFDGIFNRLLDL